MKQLISERPMHFADWLAFQAQSRPLAPAIITPKARLNYVQLFGAVRAAANRLHKAGVRPGSTAAIWVANPALHAAVLFALNRLGVTSLSLVHAERGKTQVPSSVHVDVVIADEETTFPFCTNTILTDYSWLQDWQNSEPMPEGGFARHSEICVIATSSGTTGEPKAIALTMAEIEHRFRQQTIGHIAFGFDHKTVCLLDLGTIWGLIIYVQSLWSGAAVFSNFGKLTHRIIPDFQINRIVGSPSTIGDLARQVEADPVDCSSLRQIMAGGGLIPQALAKRIAQTLCKNIVMGYGSAEMGYVTSAPLGRLRNVTGGVGAIVPWVEAEAVDQEDKPLPPGTAGQLRFRSEIMARSYLNDPISSAKAFRDGWFYPGDIGAVTSERMLLIAGRTDDVINAGGAKFNPLSIERKLTSLEEVTDAIAFAAPTSHGADNIWVAVQPSGNFEVEGLRKLCRERLVQFPVGRLIFIKKLPRNAMGKVSRQELRSMAAKIVSRRSQDVVGSANGRGNDPDA